MKTKRNKERSMFKLNRLITAVSTALAVIMLVFLFPVFADNPTGQETSGNQTKQEETNPDFSLVRVMNDPSIPKHTIPFQTVPESEMLHITFSLEWILKNDTDLAPGGVGITFPSSWVKESPAISEGETPVILKVSERLLNANDVNTDPDSITVYFPNAYFKGMPVPANSTTLPARLREKSAYGGNATENIEYEARKEYRHTTGDNLTGAKGAVRPLSYYNPYAETFLAYQEIEFYGSTGNDAIELVMQMETDVADTQVWFAFWRNGSFYSTTPVPAEILDDMYYEWFIYGSYYYCTIIDDNGIEHYVSFYDSTPSSDFFRFIGSSEFDRINGVSNYFSVSTSPISITNLMTTYLNWQTTSYVDSRLIYNTQNDAQYVYVSGTKDSSSGLVFFEEADYYD